MRSQVILVVTWRIRGRGGTPVNFKTSSMAFEKITLFSKITQFQKHVIFRITQFQKHVIFQNHVIFKNTLFSESRNFKKHVIFQNHVIFKNTLFSESRYFRITRFSESRNFQNHAIFQNHVIFRITQFSTSMTSSEKNLPKNLYNFQDIRYDFICMLLLFSARCLWKTIKNILRGG